MTKNFHSGPFIGFKKFNTPLEEALLNTPSDFKRLYKIFFSRRLVLSVIVVLLGAIYFYRYIQNII